MSPLDRRAFLKGAAALGGTAATHGLLGSAMAASAHPLPLSTVPNPNDAPVDHVVVLMMENRSFDHYFGWLTGTNQQTYLDEVGVEHPTHHLAPDYRGCEHPDPDHSWDAGRAQRDGGFLVGRNDEFAIGYYEESDVELYAKLARQFTLCDNYHCSLLAPTFPNREYMHSAQSGGIKDNALPNQVPGHEFGFTWATIWDLLEAAGVPWAYYFVDLPAIGLWGPRLAHGARHIEHFYADAASGTLPNVVFVDPGFTTGYRTDEHPHGDMRAGQAFAHNVLKAVVEAPTWGSTAMFVNYDEWGGFFDSSQGNPKKYPPRAPDDRATVRGDVDDFGQLGFRVPAIVVSPYSRIGVLSSSLAPEKGRFYDHTSILKFIEWRFGLPALTTRDAAAANIGTELLDFTQAPRLDAAEIVDLLPRVPVTSLACEGDTLAGIPGAPAVPAAAPAHSDFDAAFASGWFESVGYRLEPRSLETALGG